MRSLGLVKKPSTYLLIRICNRSHAPKVPPFCNSSLLLPDFLGCTPFFYPGSDTTQGSPFISSGQKHFATGHSLVVSFARVLVGVEMPTNPATSFLPPKHLTG